MTLTYASTPPTESTAWTIVTTTLTTPSTVGAIAALGWNVAIPTKTPSSSSTVFNISPTSSTVQTSPAPSSDNLSTGEKAGIGVGVSLGIIGLIALLWTVLLLRRKQQTPSNDNNNNNSNQGPMDNNSFNDVFLRPYSETQYHPANPAPPSELPGQWDPPELGHGQQRSPVELE